MPKFIYLVRILGWVTLRIYSKMKWECVLAYLNKLPIEKA